MSHTETDRHVTDRLGEHLEGDLSLAEFARVDAHLKRCEECAVELRELRATVAMLRELSDPEPPIGLTERVIARIESGEGRQPSKVFTLVRRVQEPRFAAALAAGVCGLLAISSFDFSSGDFLGTPSGTSPQEIVLPSDFGSATNVRAARASRPLSLSRTHVAHLPGHVRIGAPHVQDDSQRTELASGYGFFGNAAPEVPLRDLDGELDALMRDPATFVERFRHTEEGSRRSMIAPLVEYSARRGDASAVALFASGAARPMAVPASTGR